MKVEGIPTGTIDWSQVTETIHAGISGQASIRSCQLGEVQLRRIVYSSNYVSDHWCLKGHIVTVLEGEVTIEHQQGPAYPLTAGMTYHVADDQDQPHRLVTKGGGTVLVVD